MRVSRIEVFGFKSFMERLSLPLTSGVTGVVGPNGCGKSNIVDALRWVLGETRARNLRGAIAEDVIFNGTEKLRPLGLAEVTITLKAAKDNFFDELSSPALEAAQVEELLASGNDVEIALKHIQENDEVGSAEVTESVAADSVAADDVAQESPPTRDANGRPILRVISGSKDVLEESSAAGETICLRRSESESSEAKAAQPKPSEALLGRFAWLQSVSEVQVTRRLYRSGESEYFINRVACRLKDIVDFLRVVGLGPRSYTIVAQGEVSRIITSKPEERRQILEEAAGVLGFKDRIAAATRRLEETDVNIARIDDILKEVTRQVASLKRQAAKARNRAQLKEQVVTLEKQLAIDRSVRLRERGEELRKGLVELQANETNLDAELQKVQAEEQEFRGELMTIDVERDGLRTKIDAFKEELYAINQRRSQQRARVSELQALQRAAQTEIERLRERGTVLVNRKEQAGETLTTLQKHESEILEQISALEVTSDDDLKRVAAELTTWRDRLRAKEREFSGVREEIARAESTLEALRNQFRAASPAAQLKKTIGDQANQLASKAIGILVEGLTVPEDLTRAVQAVLAERAAFLVAENPKEIAESFISTIANNQDHAKKAPALGVFQAGEDTPLAITLPNGWELPALLSRIEVAPPYRIAAQHVLGRVFLAIDMQQAFAALALAKTHGITDLTIVTAAGDLLDSASFYSFRHEGGLVALQGKIQEISNLLEQQRFELGECEAEREQMSGMIGEREREHARLLQESQERARKLKELSQARGNAAGRLQTEKRMLEQLDSDLQRAERQTEEVRQRIAKLKGEEEEMTVQLANTGEEREGEIREQLQGLQSSAQDLDRKRQLSMERLSSMRQRLDTARRAVDSVRSHISTQTLDMQKATLEMQALKERLEGELGSEMVAELQPLLEASLAESTTHLLESTVRETMQQELTQLKNRIVREGEVDPASIEQCEQESARLDNLTKQRTDLDQAAQTLRRTITKLTEVSQARFVSTFNAVNRNFSELVPKLFGGGSARLELLDPSKPLESGIDIIARPPGKKLKSVELMSGGEKALSAICLVFAMFLERPSPLCVLDEVDAPLDEANVVRFLSMIKEMSTRIQFLMITHNKQSMTICDKLVGVTMSEPGASTVISVSLQEAYSQVA